MCAAFQMPPGIMKWDPKNLEIRTHSVEKTLEPLVMQVTTLMSTKSPSKVQKGKSVKGRVLAATVELAVQNFIHNGEAIANENPDINNEMMAAVNEVKKSGESMTIASREFADDPFNSVKRANMIRSARSLLSAVTHLLILADMVDVHHLLTSLHIVENDLEKVRTSSTQMHLVESLQTLCNNTSVLEKQALKRQAELKDSALRDDLAAARSVIQKFESLLLSSTNVHLRHPDLPVAKENRDFVLKQIHSAVAVISDIAQGRAVKSIEKVSSSDESRKLALLLSEFEKIALMDIAAFTGNETKHMLEVKLEEIIRESAMIADSASTRVERRERIIAECNRFRETLQELFSSGLLGVGNSMPSDNFNKSLTNVIRQSKSLWRQLRKAVLDHISDIFLETSVPLLAVMEVAKSGNADEIDEYVRIFTEYASKIIEVANLSCSISSNSDGVKMVQHANSQISHLCDQIVNAAKLLALRPNCNIAYDNMTSFKKLWEYEVKLLVEAVDDIMIIDDFLEVSESHILEDINKCVQSLQESDADTLDRTAGAIRGRLLRIYTVVTSEMDCYEPGIYTERVLEAASVLKHQVMLTFAQQVEMIVQSIGSSTLRDVDEHKFIDASKLVYDAVRDVRQAVLMNRSSEELEFETDVECEDNAYDAKSKSSVVTDFDEYPDISGLSNTRDAYRLVSEEEKQQIAAQVETFRCEKNKFDQEVAKWDDTGNDIIVIAKQMCMIMMEMTDFTRGKGPLKTTMDVINAAKRISGFGTKLDKLARQIADLCPESTTKKDLLAYLQRIALYCHQLNITSKVKADVQNISGNLIVSGIDSATSLIQAAKNLMNAVVLTVKASYVASTKYPRTGQVSTLIVWKMKAPEKKPIFRYEYQEEIKAGMRKGQHTKIMVPVKELNEFQTPSDSV